MPGAAPAREQMCAGGEIPPPAPWALFLAAGRLPPQPPTTPLRHHVPRDTAVVPRCLVPHTSTMHAPTSGAEHAAGTERPFPFHLHISIAEEGNDLGADHRAPEPSTYSTNLNPSPTWRLSCTQQGEKSGERGAAENPSSTAAWTECFGERTGNPRVFLTPPSLPSRLAGATKHIHNTVSLMQHQQC